MLWSGKEKREREKGLEEEGKNKEKGVVFLFTTTIVGFWK